MTEMLSPEVLTAFFQVVIIDLVLAGDNAIVIGLAAAGLPKDQRSKAILAGIAAATICESVSPALRCNCCRSSACYWPAAFSCSGFAGRCGASCVHRPNITKKMPKWRRTMEVSMLEATLASGLGRRLVRPYG